MPIACKHIHIQASSTFIILYSMAGGTNISAGDYSNERMRMLKLFDETKSGVKGLIDSRLDKIPEIFVRPQEELDEEELSRKTDRVEVPLIDLTGVESTERRKQIIEQVKFASETYGFFQVVNHGIPLTVLDGMIEGVRNFHEMDVDEKKKFYSRDFRRNVRFSSNYDLYTSKTANWRDTLNFFYSDEISVDELPNSSRTKIEEYAEQVKILGNSLLEILSAALGLKPNHLKDMEVAQGIRFSCHYYPACPEPHLTLGVTKHTDPGFITILLQSENVSSLQVLYRGEWIDVHPIQGGLVINIGDLLQLISNGVLQSPEHRVIASIKGPRISVACFLSGPIGGDKSYAPIKELVSEEHPQQYKEVLLSEYVSKFISTGLDEYRALDQYKY